MKKHMRPKRVFGYFWKKSMTEKPLFFAVAVASIITSILGSVLPIFYANIVDTISKFDGGDKTIIMWTLMSILLVIIILEFCWQVLWRVFGFCIIQLELRVMKKVFNECFAYLHKHSYRFFSNAFGGALVKRVNKLTYSYENVTDIFMFDLLRIGVSLPFMIIAVGLQNIYLGIIFLVGLSFYLGIQFFLYKWKLPDEIESNIQDSKVTATLADTITNHFNIATFASQKKENKMFDDIVSFWKKVSIKNWNKWELINAINGSVLIAFEIVLIYASIKLWWKDMISVGIIVLLQLYVFRVFRQFFMIGNVFKRLYRAIGESTEMLDILDEPHEVTDKIDSWKLKVENWKIEFKNVGFWYQDEQAIFKDLNISIKPGEKVALVGHSGAGKTTVIKVLFRFFDIQNGEILIDGQNISDVTQESLRSHLSMVPQDPILFHRSLKENIAYGKPNATMEEIVDVAKKARCHKFISTLKEGYETFVGERGIKLSWGERQRVAIARSMLEDKKILLLDEATSSLDSESEKLIQEAMDELMKKKTAIVIAHRLSTIMKMDRIIVMDEGKIIEEGTHADLLKESSGIYKKLWEIQSGGFIG